eukprot:15447568-Alexandrium_andersonii.AAC.1
MQDLQRATNRGPGRSATSRPPLPQTMPTSPAHRPLRKSLPGHHLPGRTTDTGTLHRRDTR